MKILVVEDDLPLCTGVCFELDCSGYLTVAAYTCQKAIQLMESEHFDLALLDVNLPTAAITRAFVENGLEVFEAHLCEDTLEDYFKKVTGGEGIA